jgi:hypothetical protein
MWHHISSQVKGKHKQGESSSSSSQARLDTSASLFVVIESFHFIFIFIYTWSFWIHCYILFDICYIFICRAQRPLGRNNSSFLGCCMARKSTQLLSIIWPKRPSHMLPRRWLPWSRSPPRSTRPARRLPRSRGVIVQGRWWGGCSSWGRPATTVADQLQVSWILILFRFIFVWSN